MALTTAVPFKPSVSAATLKAYALIGLNLLAAEGEAGASGSQSPVSGDMWRSGLPKESPDWASDGDWWSDSEGLSSSDFREQNVESLALHVIGLNWSGETVSLFLEHWELARVALSCHVALDILGQDMHEAW